MIEISVKRGLARSAFADDKGHLARADVGIDAVQHADGGLPGLEIAGNAARADCRFGRAAADCSGVHGFRLAHRNTEAGSVLRTERIAINPVMARITTTATKLISGICQGM